MQALETGTSSLVPLQHEEPIRVWIENADGSIARGLVEVLSENGALVRLAGPTPVTAATEVAVRIAFSPASPTLAGTARVLRVRAAGDAPECELEWTHSGPGREHLARLVVSLG